MSATIASNDAAQRQEGTGATLIKWVGIGEVKLAHGNELLATVLGSCVSIVLWHPQRRVAAMSHILLPERNSHHDKAGVSGRFADDAWSLMARMLAEEGIAIGDCECHVTGGACMFEADIGVGQGNLRRVMDILKSNRIKVRSTCIGGHDSRLVKFDPVTGQLKSRLTDRPGNLPTRQLQKTRTQKALCSHHS